MKKLCIVLSLIIAFVFCSGTALATESESPQPEALAASAEMTSYTEVTLFWTSETESAIFIIMRSDGTAENYETIGSIQGKIGEISFIDSQVKLGEQWTYKIVRMEEGSVTGETLPMQVKLQLSAPSALKTSLTKENKVKIAWSAVQGADGYYIYRSTSQTTGYVKLKTVKNTYYTDGNVVQGQAYYYKVIAYKDGMPSASSQFSQVKAYYMKPAAPVVSGKNLNGKAKLTWKQISGAQTYYIYRKNADKKYVKIGETKKLTYTDKTAKKHTQQYYKVTAVYEQDGNLIQSSKSNACRILTRYIDPDKKMVALTFDDGPSKYTKAIVKCLKNNNSAATFFVVGNRVDSYKSTVKYTYENGCEIANHSYSHPIYTGLSSSSIKSQIRKTDNKVKKITGEKPVLARAPGGGYNDKVKKAVGKPLIQWSIDTLDWKTRSKKATVKAVLNNVKDGDIVLMHDLHGPTKDAALELIPKLKKKGYQIVTVSELAKYKGYKLKNGSVYFSFR